MNDYTLSRNQPARAEPRYEYWSVDPDVEYRGWLTMDEAIEWEIEHEAELDTEYVTEDQLSGRPRAWRPAPPAASTEEEGDRHGQ